MDALTKPKRKSLPATRRAPYPDLHDHIRALDAAGLLIRVDRPINKDTEMHPLVRWQFRGGIPEDQRKAYYDAENEAVDMINADFYKYAHHVTAHAKGALKPNELLRAFVHYKHVDYYDVTTFSRAYDWMKARGMSEGQSQHAALVIG